MNKKEQQHIEELIKLVQDTGIAEIEVKSPEGGSVRIRQHAPMSTATEYVAASPMLYTAATALSQSSSETQHTTPKEQGRTIRAPLIGTVYLAPSPDAETFVQVGKHVAAGDTLCLIEAMKTFNKIEADKAGTIKSCLVEDSQPVEYDQALFVIATDDDD